MTSTISNFDTIDTIAIEENHNENDNHEIKTSSNNLQIYRYKPSVDIVNKLSEFSRIHQNDDRIQFKNAWARWMDNNTTLLNSEVNRLNDLGYKGDIYDKLYKSARYYYKKKNISQQEQLSKKHDKSKSDSDSNYSRRQYISVRQDLIQSMDDHLESKLHTENFTPAKAYNHFCQHCTEIIKEEIEHILISHTLSDTDLVLKIKKTYKNRYYQLTKKQKEQNK